MDTSEVVMTGDLARAARALAQVAAGYVAEAAELSEDRLRAYERGRGTLEVDEALRLRRALEELGITFIPDDDTAGHGVRHTFNRGKVKRLGVWEGEGGPAYDDDI